MGGGGLNACQDGLGYPYIWVEMREEVPQGASLSEGGGCNRYLGNARSDPATFSVGLPLNGRFCCQDFKSKLDIKNFLKVSKSRFTCL